VRILRVFMRNVAVKGVTLKMGLKRLKSDPLVERMVREKYGVLGEREAGDLAFKVCKAIIRRAGTRLVGRGAGLWGLEGHPIVFRAGPERDAAAVAADWLQGGDNLEYRKRVVFRRRRLKLVRAMPLKRLEKICDRLMQRRAFWVHDRYEFYLRLLDLLLNEPSRAFKDDLLTAPPPLFTPSQLKELKKWFTENV